MRKNSFKNKKVRNTYLVLSTGELTLQTNVAFSIDDAHCSTIAKDHQYLVSKSLQILRTDQPGQAAQQILLI